MDELLTQDRGSIQFSGLPTPISWKASSVDKTLASGHLCFTPATLHPMRLEAVESQKHQRGPDPSHLLSLTSSGTCMAVTDFNVLLQLLGEPAWVTAQESWVQDNKCLHYLGKEPAWGLRRVQKLDAWHFLWLRLSSAAEGTIPSLVRNHGSHTILHWVAKNKTKGKCSLN